MTSPATAAPPEKPSTRDRLVTAAFDLYGSQGFERTTVDQIASVAGVSRATYFRYFPNKESVVFPQHEAIADAVAARLDASRSDSRGDVGKALHEAAAIVLRHYLAEGELARQRYRLTRRVPPLRDAEIAGQVRYQHLFRQHLGRWFPAAEDAVLVEVLAHAVVTAHNHVLRNWLRGHESDPERALSLALNEVTERLWPGPRASVDRSGTRVLVFDSTLSPDQVLARLQET